MERIGGKSPPKRSKTAMMLVVGSCPKRRSTKYRIEEYPGFDISKSYHSAGEVGLARVLDPLGFQLEFAKSRCAPVNLKAPFRFMV